MQIDAIFNEIDICINSYERDKFYFDFDGVTRIQTLFAKARDKRVTREDIQKFDALQQKFSVVTTQKNLCRVLAESKLFENLPISNLVTLIQVQV